MVAVSVPSFAIYVLSHLLLATTVPSVAHAAKLEDQKIDSAGDLGSITDDGRGNILPRTWDIIASPSFSLRVDPNQDIASLIAMESDPFRFTEMPSSAPSSVPTPSPTSVPTPSPTEDPTTSPTARPTASPTTPFPTGSPTISAQPTIDPEFFSYDPKHPRGPANWGSMRGKDAFEAKSWKENREYIAQNLNDNVCNNPNSRRQSPIDVSFEKSHGQCFEYHEIRHQAGHISVADPRVDAKILPTKLRIDYPYNVMDKKDVLEMPEEKRPLWTEMAWLPDDKTGMLELKVRDTVEGPSADIPKGWGYQLPVTHVDIKMPSEHWMEGKQYAAEYQLYLIQNLAKQRGAPAVSVLIDFDENDIPNPALQIVLDRFQAEFDKDEAMCEKKRRKERRLGAIIDRNSNNIRQDQSTWLDEPEEEKEKFRKHLRRALQKAESAKQGKNMKKPDIPKPKASPTKPPTTPPQGNYTYFDPWDENIFRSIWFFGYEGSLTEPPCTEFVEWRIIDTPTTMSRKQFRQMRNLLFNHVDEDCNPTSAAHEGSVARPLQPYNGRMVHRCMCRDFISDRARRKGYKNQRCTWGDRKSFGFEGDEYGLDWYESTHRYEEPDHQSCALFGEKCDGWNQFLGNRDASYIMRIQDRVRRGELADMRLAGLLPSNAEVTARAGASDVSDTAAILSGASGSAAIPSGSPTATAMPVESAGPPINTFSELLPGLYPETLETIQKKVAKWEEMERMPSGAPSSHAPSVQPSASPVAFSLP